MRGASGEIMKLLAALFLALICAACDTPTYTPTPNSRLGELLEDLKPVHPLPADDPQIVRLKNYCAAHKLKWDISIGVSGVNYCVTIHNSIVRDTSCKHTIDKATDEVIGDFERGTLVQEPFASGGE